MSDSGLVTGKKVETIIITATTKNNKQSTILINIVYVNGTAIYYNSETNKNCNESEAISTTGTKIGCMKWYTFNDNKSSSTVNLILDHNTTASIQWKSSESLDDIMSKVNNSLSSNKATWTSNLNVRLIIADEIVKIAGTKDFDGKTTIGSGYIKINIYAKETTIQESSKYA